MLHAPALRPLEVERHDSAPSSRLGTVMTGASELEATLMGLCNDFVEVHRRLAQLESLLPWEELPAPPAKRQCVTQVTVPEPIARPPPKPAEGCGPQPPSAVPSAQGGRCSKGHLLKRAVF